MAVRRALVQVFSGLGDKLMRAPCSTGWVIAGSLLIGVPIPAFAQTEALSRDPRFALDSWLGASTPSSASGGFNLSYAPYSSINEDGWRLLLGTNGGGYTYRFEPTKRVVVGTYNDTGLALGYAFSPVPGYSLTASLGPSLASSKAFNDPNGSKLETEFGAKGGLSLYATPSAGTMMFGIGTYSTAQSSYFLFGKFGFAWLGGVYVGPEAAALGSDNYRQYKIGAHLSGVSVGSFQFGISAGRFIEPEGRTGEYMGLSARTTF